MPAKKPIGQRNTSQREAIEAAILAAPGPLTVDEILQQAGRGEQSLGIATVYRTVKLLLETGRIQAVVLPDGQTRYESAELGHHHHFRCTECKRVFDLDVCPVDQPLKPRLPAGFVVEDHELTFFGLCPECSGGKTPKRNARPAAKSRQGHDDCGHKHH